MKKIRLGVLFVPGEAFDPLLPFVKSEGLIGTAAAIIGGSLIAGGATAAGAVIGKSAMDSASDKQAYVAAEQLKASKEEIAAQRAERAEAVRVAGQLSARSYGETAAIGRMLQNRDQALKASMDGLNKEMELLDQTDPVIREAGGQLLKLMQGESAKILEPIRAEQANQRRDLEGKLASAMGPGWRTSSAGIEAMSKFDAASSSALVNAQFQGINQLTGVFSNVAAARPKNIGLQATEIFKGISSMDSAIGSMESGIQNRIVGSDLAARSGSPVNFGATTNALGGQYGSAGQYDAKSGQLWGDMFGGLAKIGGYVAGKGFGGGDSASLLPGSGSGISVPPIPDLNPTFGSLLK